MEIQENWALPAERIEAFLMSGEGVCRLGPGHYAFGKCRLRLTARPPEKLGPITVPRTRLTYSGPEEDTEKLRRIVTLNFLSAGG